MDPSVPAASVVTEGLGWAGRSTGLFRWLLVGLTLLYLVPIWSVDHIPTQDGPLHLESASTVLQYGEPGTDHARYFKRNTDLVPNWFSQVFLIGAMRVVSPRMAEKMLLSFYVLLFAGAVAWLLSVVGRDRTFYALLGFPFIYNYLLHIGLYNFVISVPLLLLVIGWWWKEKDPLGWRTLLLLDVFLVLLYFTHLVSLVVAWAVLPILAIFRHRLRLRGVLCLALALLPTSLLPFHFLHSWGTDVSRFRPMTQALGDLASINVLASFSPADHLVGRLLGVIFFGLVFHTVLSRMRDSASSHSSVGEGWRGRLRPEDGFLAAALCCVGLYLVAPENVSEGSLVVDRVGFFPFLLILPWLEPGFRHRAVKGLVGAAVVVLSVVHVAQTTHHYRGVAPALGDYLSGIPFVHPNDTILPIHFGSYSEPLEDRPYFRIDPLLHAVGHYCTDAGAIGLSNIQGNKPLFPMTYREEVHPFKTLGDLHSRYAPDIHPSWYPEPIDIILVWNWTGSVDPVNEPMELERLTRHYRLVHRTSRLQLYRWNEDGEGGV